MNRSKKAAKQVKYTALRNPSDQLQALNTYSNGVMRRYYLLFAVNGGALAIAKLLGGGEKVAGGLGFGALAIGCIIFTALVWRDIYSFAEMIRVRYLGGEGVFEEGGKLILATLCILLIIAWALAAFGH